MDSVHGGCGASIETEGSLGSEGWNDEVGVRADCVSAMRCVRLLVVSSTATNGIATAAAAAAAVAAVRGQIVCYDSVALCAAFPSLGRSISISTISGSVFVGLDI